MTLPTGQISMSQVNTELGRSSTAQISLNDSGVRTLAGISSGQIGMNSLRGKSSVIPVFILVQSGGGGGGGTLYGGSGGGGGGAGCIVRTLAPGEGGTGIPFTAGVSWAIVIGAGGVGGQNYNYVAGTGPYAGSGDFDSGTNSSFNTPWGLYAATFTGTMGATSTRGGGAGSQTYGEPGVGGKGGDYVGWNYSSGLAGGDPSSLLNSQPGIYYLTGGGGGAGIGGTGGMPQQYIPYTGYAGHAVYANGGNGGSGTYFGSGNIVYPGYYFGGGGGGGTGNPGFSSSGYADPVGGSGGAGGAGPGSYSNYMTSGSLIEAVSTHATANSGSGGGGGGSFIEYYSPEYSNGGRGGNGGSGQVWIQYGSQYPAATFTGSYQDLSSGSYRTYKILSSGNFKIG